MSGNFHNHDDGRRHVSTREGAGKGLSALAAVLGLISLAAAVAVVAHAVMPSKWASPSASALMAVSILMAVAAVVCAVIARRSGRRSGARGHRGTVAMLVVVLAVLCMLLGSLIGRMVPDGIVKPSVRDVAPVGNTLQMKRGVEQVAGVCAKGWRDVDAANYPGVRDISFCEDNRMAFVTFDTAASASMDRGFVKSAIAQQLQDHASDARTKGDWKILNGGRWMVVGERTRILALQRSWGGSVESVS